MKNELIKKFNLKKLMNKDYLKEFYISKSSYENKRLFSNVYYLLEKKEIFPFHKMKSYSTWQYCMGNKALLHIIKGLNKIKTIILGDDIKNGEQLMYITEPNTWFCAQSTENGLYDFSFFIHFISPSYLEEEDEFGTYNKIIKEIPNYKDFAKKYSCKKEKYRFSEKDYSVKNYD